MATIFLCYRSQDDAYAAALLDEKLSAVFGQDAVFRASRSIKPGDNYSDAIMATLESCETVVVIVGPTWLEHIEKSGNYAPSRSDDWVRLEITTALARGKQVIPVLLSQTTRFHANDLPSDIADLAYKQYLRLDHRNIADDLERIVATLDQDRNTTAGGPQRVTRNRQNLILHSETTADGSLELDVVSRDEHGKIIGRLSGRLRSDDIENVAHLIAESSTAT